MRLSRQTREGSVPNHSERRTLRTRASWANSLVPIGRNFCDEVLARIFKQRLAQLPWMWGIERYGNHFRPNWRRLCQIVSTGIPVKIISAIFQRSFPVESGRAVFLSFTLKWTFVFYLVYLWSGFTAKLIHTGSSPSTMRTAVLRSSDMALLAIQV